MLIGKQFGRYEIRSKIGAGGMGEVYTAHDAELDRRVAVKLLPSEFSDDETRKLRFRQEARSVSALNHPNIITIYEIGENEHGNFLVTELIDGTTLREVIKHEPLSLVRTLKIVEQTANALVAAHQAHIVHRDIKPENVMVRRDGIVKVLDFGLAKPTLHSDGENDLAKTIPGMVMGSVRYMSPEQTRGLIVDERTDVWSLGVVLYEMLTGHAPFNGATTSDTIAAVIYKEPEPLAQLAPNAPAELQRIVRKALQKDRDERYQSIKDFALDIKNLIYELEHESSGERSRTISKDFDISENPTMIHQTNSANYPTTAFSKSGAQHTTEKSQKRGWLMPLAVLGVIAVFSIIAFGFYKWFGAKPNLSAGAFEKTQAVRVNTDGKAASPAISPDGKYVAYLSGDVGSRSIVVRQISTDSTVTVVPATALNLFGVTFSPTGDYIYYLQTSEDSVINTLYRVPTLGGASKKLIEDVDSRVTFSPNGKQLAFQRNASKEAITIILTADVDGTNVQPLIRSDQTEFNVIGNPCWSPDGSTILVRAFNNFGGTVEKNQIAEISVAEKSLKVLPTRDLYAVFDFSWLNDNSGFLFTGQETQSSPVQIFRAEYPSGEFRAVTNDTNSYNSLDLTTDGKTIVTLKNNSSSSFWKFNPANKQLDQLTAETPNLDGLSGLSQTSNGKIIYTSKNGTAPTFWMMDADAKNARQIPAEVKSVFNSPKITPDGRYIVFSSKNSGTARIWRMDADGKNLAQLTKEKTNFGDFNPQITPDGKTVIYQEYASGMNAESSFMKVSIDGGEPSILYHDDQYSVFNHEISPDGKFIAYDSYRKTDFDKKVRIAAFENGSLGQVVKEFDANSINGYVWSPDGKSLTFLSNRNGVQNLWRLPIDGSNPQPVTDFKSGRIFNYEWSADGKNLLIVRGNVNSDLILIHDSGAESRS